MRNDIFMDDTLFSIEFPILKDTSISGPIIAGRCDSNSNYYTSGQQRATCCCDCDSN